MAKLSVRYWRETNGTTLDFGVDDRGLPTFSAAFAQEFAAHLIAQGLAVCVELRTDPKGPPQATAVRHPVTGALAWLK